MHVFAALGLLVLALSAANTMPFVLPLVYLAVVTPWLWSIDVREHRLPNWLVFPGYLVCAAAGALAVVIGTGIPTAALLSAATYLGGTLVLACVGGMGLGDVKLAGVLGFAAGALSPTAAIVSPLAAFAIGGVAATIALLRSGPKRRIAFGPYLLLGFWIAVLANRLG